jgi:uncharacterized protein YbjT (DUF2867 family)
MSITSTHNKPILVTGAAGDVDAVGRHITANLLAKGYKVRSAIATYRSLPGQTSFANTGYLPTSSTTSQ